MKSLRIAILIGAALLAPGAAHSDEPVPPKILIPVPDAERGRYLFAAKGCVICHSVNGVGGEAGPALDAPGYDGEIDPLDFAARMWRGAVAMSALQSLELGYQIDLSGGEIADIAAFVASEEHRGMFSEDDVPEIIRGWTLDSMIGALGEGTVFGAPPETTGEPGDAPADATRGYVLAERWCADCHAVGPDRDGADAGPPFAGVAARPETSEEAIRGWLSQPHEKMPEFLNLTNTDLGDLAAYIMSLRP